MIAGNKKNKLHRGGEDCFIARLNIRYAILISWDGTIFTKIFFFR